MYKRCIAGLYLLILFVSCITYKPNPIRSDLAERLCNAEQLTIMVDEQEFDSAPPINFFIGEFAAYFKNKGINVRINKEIKNTSSCDKGIYITPVFSCQNYLTWNGSWIYKFYNIKLECRDKCNIKFNIYLGNIDSNTSINSLVYIFSQTIVAPK